MSPPEERRRSARLLSEYPLVLLDASGKVLDDRALAHDLSDHGFKSESQAKLERGQAVRFRLSLDAAGEISARGRVAWTQNLAMAEWAGVEFSGLSWGERRILRRVTRPAAADWSVVAGKAAAALFWIIGTALAARVLSSPRWRGFALSLLPAVVAALAMGAALLVLLRPPRR